MSRNIVYIRVLLVVLAVVILLAFVNRSPQQSARDAWLPSSFNPVGAGTQALYQTLQESHWPVERWRDPLGRLSGNGPGDTLLITRSPVGARVAFSEQEAELLEKWVSKGNTLFLLGPLEESDDTRQLLRQFNFVLADKNQKVSDLFHPFGMQAGPPLQIPANGEMHGTLVLPPHTDPLPPGLPKNAQVLWQSMGQAYIVNVPHGTGHLICVASARLLSTEYLDKGNNLSIVLQLLAPGGQAPHRLIFEESHHGFSAIYALAHLWNHPGFRFAVLLTLLGAAVFFGSSMVRFGPVIPLYRDSGRSTLEFVDSIADLYQRADLRNEMIGYLFTETHQRILARLNLPPTTSHEIIAERLLRANPHLPKWKKLAQRFDSHDYMAGLPPTGWLRVARELIEIKSAMA